MTAKHHLLLLLGWLLGCTAWATTRNLAPLATATASSQLDEAHAAACVNDGIIRVKNHGSWASRVDMYFWGEIDFPWVQLTWEEPVTISRVVIYDRPEADATCSGGELIFDDGERILVREIPSDGSPREISFPAHRTRTLRFQITDGDGSHIGLSEIEAYEAPEATADCLELVDPYIETTRGRYFFFATGSQPFGMISAAPLTRNKNQGGGGYNYNATEVLGFPQIHAWMLGGLVMMPTTGAQSAASPLPSSAGGEDASAARSRCSLTGGSEERLLSSQFLHAGEEVQPAYHRLFLERYGTWVEQTSTDRASIYRITYTDTAEAHILMNLGGYVGTNTMVGAHWTQTDDRTVEGYFDTTGRLWGGPERVRIFFVCQFSEPMEQLTTFGTYTDQATPRNEGMSYADAPAYGFAAHFHHQTAGQQLLLKMAVSYTSTANARQNLTEIPAFDFDGTRRQSQQQWREWLGRIEVKGGQWQDRVKFYTDLWHALLGRHKLDDQSGDYPDYASSTPLTGEGNSYQHHHYPAKLAVKNVYHARLSTPRPAREKQGGGVHHFYNSDALWGSRWNLNILWGLAYPDVLDDFAASFLQTSLNGGLLARGPCAGGYSWIMSGCPATPLITSAFQRGICRKFSPEVALREMVRNHQRGGMQAWRQDDDLDFYETHGYVPNQAGLTVQWAFEDWALAEMASALARTTKNRSKRRDLELTADRFYRRSSGWPASFCDSLGLLLPRTKEGTWLHTNPLNGWGFEEANAWQATFGLSHDLPRLAELMGGPEALCQKLNYAFEQSAKDNFMSDYSNGYVNYGNQPGLSNAHVFARCGRPDLTQKWVRRVRQQTYGGITPDKGYGGHDEDQGQMASLSALMSMGLFAVDGGSSQSPAYDITAPLFDEVIIHLNPDYNTGKTFRIVSHHQGPDNCYIRQATLNGTPLKELSLSHRAFSQGGTLELQLSSRQPSADRP